MSGDYKSVGHEMEFKSSSDPRSVFFCLREDENSKYPAHKNICERVNSFKDLTSETAKVQGEKRWKLKNVLDDEKNPIPIMIH